MNKYKFGDKVHIKPLNLDGKVLGWTLKIINGVECTCKYGVETLINGVLHIAGDVSEDDLELIEYNECSCDCCDCCGHDVCEDSDCDESNWDDDDDFENNKEAENFNNDKKFNLGNLATSLIYPQIKEYYYDEKTATTIVKWTDGTTTKVKAAKGDTPDQHTGLANAVAKKYFGNGNLFAREAKWWIVDEPKYRKEEEEFCKKYDEEQARKAEKRKANRERRIINAKALARKREYEARKLAEKKYGVPAEWNENE